MLSSVAALPADRRASAFRQFPRGCGRHHNAAAGLPPRHPVPKTAAATKPPLPNPSLARVANKSIPCISAVRRYPPGCGRVVAVSKPLASLGEAGSEADAGKPTAVEGNVDAKARACDREVMMPASALDLGEFNSNGGMQNEGGGDAGAQEEAGGKPWVVTGLMAVPFLPWAQHGRRSQRLNA
ncbi:hypothetical protein SEVIR_4G034700v4 [Setaria viridis]|uniref:Uncharacterized protein n=1 Tax=Setaria viridis TaxID=4556 RepID=A0A4V6D7W1_SETVI|nr:hypothetical protein SEVIR_4G034700v2 [Setaria viridis]